MEYSDLLDKIDQKLEQKLEKTEERILSEVNTTIKNVQDKQQIICKNQCDILKNINEKIVGNGKPGLIERVGVMERSIKIYNYIIGIAVTAGLGFIIVDLIRKYLKSGLSS